MLKSPYGNTQKLIIIIIIIKNDRHNSAPEHAERGPSFLQGRTRNNIIYLINHDVLQWQLTHVNTGPGIMP